MKTRCCICGSVIDKENSYSARPYKKYDCCEKCLKEHVIPKRLKMIKNKKEDYKDTRVIIMY